MERVILVDKADNQVGTEEKIKAHEEGRLHRAFSVFVFNDKGELLLQKRSAQKYHSGGLWANTCCSHPRPGEGLLEAAHRRLREEMGFDCHLKKLFSFVYKVPFGNGLTEHEYDHVLFGIYPQSPEPNPSEVDSWKWISLSELGVDIKKNPETYSYWLRASFDELVRRLGSNLR